MLLITKYTRHAFHKRDPAAGTHSTPQNNYHIILRLLAHGFVVAAAVLVLRALVVALAALSGDVFSAAKFLAGSC